MANDDLNPHTEPGATDGTTPDPQDATFTIEDAPEETAEETIKRLAALPPIKYENARVTEAKRLGWRVSQLDNLVRSERGADTRPGQRQIEIGDADPWPKPVRLDAVLDEAASAVRRHVIMSPHAVDLVALWVAHTYVYTCFQHTPRLGITSPTKRCGKSTLVDVLRALSRRTIKADSISAAGVYRTIEVLRPLTLIIDEADTFLRDNEELRGVLNSGFDAGGQVIRVVEIGGDQVPVAFETFAPTALAAIGNLPATLSDRSIPITLQRKALAETVEKLRENGNRDTLTNIARKLARWAADSANRLAGSPPVPDALNDREADISIPILSIADAAGGSWPNRAREALKAIFAARERDGDGSDLRSLLLADIRDLFNKNRADRMSSTAICSALAEMEDRPWPEYARSKRPISKVQLANALRPFKVYPETVWLGMESSKGYHLDKFADAFAKYLPQPADLPEQSSQDDPDEALL